MQVKTVLVPYDFSEHADRALTWAHDFAADWGATIIVLNATPPITHVAHAELTWETDRIEAELLADAEKRLEELAQRMRSQGVSFKTQAIRGDPVGSICQAAEQDQVDLIIMGSHGRTGLAHVFLGSVAERVVRHAPCPVLVVRE